jgi:hypothetical protein
LIPFAQECARKRPCAIPLVQEDGAAAHAHKQQASVFALEGVARLLWPGNSPDLNAIEPAWFWLKRRTTSQGAPTSRKEMEKRWIRAWKDLPQETIQSFIERIPHHIQEIIRLEGGNEYEEGIPGFKRSWKADRLKGKLSSLAYVDPSRTTFNVVLQHHERQELADDEVHGSEVEDECLWDSGAEERYDNDEA